MDLSKLVFLPFFLEISGAKKGAPPQLEDDSFKLFSVIVHSLPPPLLRRRRRRLLFIFERERKHVQVGEGQRDRRRQRESQAGSALSAWSLMWGSNS